VCCSPENVYTTVLEIQLKPFQYPEANIYEKHMISENCIRFFKQSTTRMVNGVGFFEKESECILIYYNEKESGKVFFHSLEFSFSVAFSNGIVAHKIAGSQKFVRFGELTGSRRFLLDQWSFSCSFFAVLFSISQTNPRGIHKKGVSEVDL
jgi:hypothetical protein